VAVPGGPYAGTEGTAIAFDGSGSSDPGGTALTYAWTFGDGASGTGAKPTHAYATSGSFTVTLTVTNAGGTASTPATTTATVANVAPAVTAGPAQTVTAGSVLTLSASFSDPGTDGPWAYTITWGDGSPATTGSATSQGPITATHTYAAAGTNTVNVAVTDKAGATGTGQAIITVTQPPPPVAVPGGPYAGTEGTAIAFDGSGSSDPGGTALTYAWTFGDGASGTGAKPTHAYATSGSFSVTLTVTNARGIVSTPVTTTAAVANVAPTVTAGPAQTVTAGSVLTLSASFSDPGTDGPWAYTITWGDGSAATTGSAASQGPITATHTYAAVGTNTANVAVTDKGGATGTGQAIITVTQSPPPTGAVTFVGAGDIAECGATDDEATARILDTIPGSVFAVGDNAYPNGTLTNYQTCYDPTWGRHKYRTYPAPGNHDYDSSATAAGYFGYFGAAAGTPGQGYYSFDLGAWHIIVLNSSNAYVSTAVGSPQEQWLKADLAASTKKCQLAIFHHPRYYSTTSSAFYPTGSVKPFWDDLYAAGAELIINGHMHDYERFAPQTPAGAPDSARGIREIIVGTGGGGLDRPNTLFLPTSQAYITGVFGVLRLTLGDGSYAWQFIPVGQGPTDAGSGTCH
jgi:PKD repeat protein